MSVESEHAAARRREHDRRLKGWQGGPLVGKSIDGARPEMVIVDEPYRSLDGDINKMPAGIEMTVTFIDNDGNPITQPRDYKTGSDRPMPGWLTKADREREAREYVEANNLAMMSANEYRDVKADLFLTQTREQLDRLEEQTRRAIAKASAPQVYVPGIGQFSTYQPFDGWAMGWPVVRGTDVELPFEEEL